ncbi:MAG: PhnD/SsuA/transferrin family substrate-binding protein [Chloroflexota bacterium]
MNGYSFIVCPHDTVHGSESWFRFAQYLARKLEINIHFDLSMDFEEFHARLDSADIAYANPKDTFKLVEQRNFTLVARADELYDELVFVANTDIANPSIESLQDARIVTVKSMLPTNIALYMLRKQSITPTEFIDVESWLSVMRCVWQGEANYGIVYKDTYEGFSEQSKGMVNAFLTSHEQVAFHAMTISPELEHRRSDFEQVLIAMDGDHLGQEILSQLNHIHKWTAITQDEIALMEQVLHSYAAQ